MKHKAKYKVGDKVRVKSLDWFKKYCEHNNLYNYYVYKGNHAVFVEPMQQLCGQVVTICEVINTDHVSYHIAEDEDKWTFTNWMLEKADKETKEDTKESNIIKGDVIMKYKVGDKVRVKPYSWFKKYHIREEETTDTLGGFRNKDVETDGYETDFINDEMLEWCGKEVTITYAYRNYYTIGACGFRWADWMLEDEEEKENKAMYIIIDKEDMGLVTKGLDFKDCFFNTLCEAEVEAQKYAKDMDISLDKLCVLSMTDNTDVYEFTSELSHAYELGAIKEK